MKLLCERLTQTNCILQTFRFYWCLISPASCGLLPAILSTSHSFTDRDFSETKLDASALKLLCEGLEDPNCKLQMLKLCASFLPESSEAVCKYLASVLICNPNLTELDLSENTLGDIGVKCLCEGLTHSNCKVEKLELSTCYLTDANCVELSSILQVSRILGAICGYQCLAGHGSTASLWGSTAWEGLWTCHLTRECCQDLCNALYTNEHLRYLDFNDNALGDKGMKVLCEGLKYPAN